LPAISLKIEICAIPVLLQPSWAIALMKSLGLSLHTSHKAGFVAETAKFCPILS
jgi:hypothetical protein